MADTNFDNLAPRFTRNIYESQKGQIRLAILKRDFDQYVKPAGGWQGANVLDAGAGQGQFSLGLASEGANVTLCDISEKMLDEAENRFQQAGIDPARFQIQHCALQAVGEQQPGPYDIVLCHAVTEWLDKPEDTFDHLLPLLKPGGFLSLIFYNVHGLAFKNLLRTNFKRFDRNSFQSRRGSLTPINPLSPDAVLSMAQKYKVNVIAKSGIRVFHDYIFNRDDREREPEALQEKELEYSQLEPFWKMARYIHFLFKK